MAQTTMLYKRYTAEFKGITTWIKKKINYIMEFFHLRSFFAKTNFLLL